MYKKKLTHPNSQFLHSQHDDHNLICFSSLLQRMFLAAGQLNCGGGGVWSKVGGGDVPSFLCIHMVEIEK